MKDNPNLKTHNVYTMIKDIDAHIKKIEKELESKFGNKKDPWGKIKAVVKGMK